MILAVTLYDRRDKDHDLATLGMISRVAKGIIGAFCPGTLALLWLATASGDDAPDPTATSSPLIDAGRHALHRNVFCCREHAVRVASAFGRMIPMVLGWNGVFASLLLVICLPCNWPAFSGPLIQWMWLPMFFSKSRSPWVPHSRRRAARAGTGRIETKIVRGFVGRQQSKSRHRHPPWRDQEEEQRRSCRCLWASLPALWLGVQSHPSWQRCLLGLIIGLIWGNGFEYAYHRFLLHCPRTQHGAAHQEHHAQIGTPQEAEFVALISSPLNILLLFLINGVPGFPHQPAARVTGDSLRGLHWLVGVSDSMRGSPLADSHERLATSRTSLRPRVSPEPS